MLAKKWKQHVVQSDSNSSGGSRHTVDLPCSRPQRGIAVSLPLRSIGVILLIGAVAACSTAPQKPPRESRIPKSEQAPPRAVPEVAPQAAAFEQAGNYEAAAREYARIASEEPEPLRSELLLRSTAALLKGNFLEEAKRTLQSIPRDNLPADTQIRRQITEARLAVAEQRGRDALTILQVLTIAQADSSLSSQFYSLRAEAYLLTGQPKKAVADLVTLEPLQRDPAALHASQAKLWQLLNSIPLDSIREMQRESTSDALQGWLRLAELGKIYQLPGVQLETEIADWRMRYPLHRAPEEIVQSLVTLKQDQTYLPQHIALLLPQSGAFGKSAAAVRDGFLAAYLSREDREYTPSVRVYDSGELPQQANAAYDQAVADGADIVVGPLIKEEVAALAQREQLAVPTLALNYVESERRPRNLFQFGLDPEEEARQVAEQAWLDGHNQAVVLAPTGSWGERLSESFRNHWQQLGGQLLEIQTFNNGDADFSQPLQQLLNIDESYGRFKALKQALRTEVKFEPRRRADADFIFVAASPQQARQIRPQLKFYYAADLPVYATSHVFSGNVDAALDRDMDGIMFPDMPWTLSTIPSPLWVSIEESWGARSRPYRRLYGLGVDTFNVIPQLRRLSNYRFQQFRGVTGVLSLNELNQMQRHLTWAKFAAGIPKVRESNDGL
jgi:outer membrane PBP1 activator LpoA protein